MTRVHRRRPLRLLAITALLSFGACGDDTDSPPNEFSTPTRRGAITVGTGTGLGPIVEMEVASDGTIFANQERGQIRRFNMDGEDVRILTITARRFAVSANRLFALDRRENRIAVHDWNGTFLHDFSFEAPAGFDDYRDFDLAATPDNIVYLLDPRLRRVQKLSSTGEVLAVWGTRGVGPGQLEVPTRIVVDREGRILILDIDLWRVQRFTAEGQHDRTWDLERTIQFDDLLDGDLAVDIQGRPLILEYPTLPIRIVTLEANGPGATTWFVPEEGAPPFEPLTLAVLPNNDRLLADPYHGNLDRYTPEWTRLGPVGHPIGSRPGEVLHIDDVAILGSDRVVIWDSERRLLESFDSSGGDPKTIPIPSDRKQGIARLRGARDGGLWVEGYDGFFTLIEPSGRTLARWLNQVSGRFLFVHDFEPLADGGLALLVNSRDNVPATLELRGRDGTPGKSFKVPPLGDHAYIDVAIGPRGHAWLLDSDGVIRQADLRFAGGTAEDWSVLGSAVLVTPAAIASDGAGFLHIMDTGRGAVVVLNRPGYEVGQYGEGDLPIEDSSSNDLPRSHHRRCLAVGESGLVTFSVDSQLAPIYAP